MTDQNWLESFMPAHAEHVAAIVNRAVNELTPERQEQLYAGLKLGTHAINVLTTMEPLSVRVMVRPKEGDGTQYTIWLWEP